MDNSELFKKMDAEMLKLLKKAKCISIDDNERLENILKNEK